MPLSWPHPRETHRGRPRAQTELCFKKPCLPTMTCLPSQPPLPPWIYSKNYYFSFRAEDITSILEGCFVSDDGNFHPQSFELRISWSSSDNLDSFLFSRFQENTKTPTKCPRNFTVFFHQRKHHVQRSIKITEIFFVTVVGFLACWTPIIVIDFTDTFRGKVIFQRQVYFFSVPCSCAPFGFY